MFIQSWETGNLYNLKLSKGLLVVADETVSGFGDEGDEHAVMLLLNDFERVEICRGDYFYCQSLLEYVADALEINRLTIFTRSMFDSYEGHRIASF